MEQSRFTRQFKAQNTSILERIGNGDKSAIRDCLDTYGNLIWELAKNHTDSVEEAETAVREIFLDVWKCAGSYDADKLSETAFVYMIARRLLTKKSKVLK